MVASAAQLQEACNAIERGEMEAAMACIGDADGPAADSVRAVVQACLLEQAGELDGARDWFAAACDTGLPLAALLRQCTRFFTSIADYHRAFRCVALLDGFEPGSIRNWVQAQPPEVLARNASAVVRAIRLGPRPLFGALRSVKRALVDAYGPDAAAVALAGMQGLRLGEVRRVYVESLSAVARSRGRSVKEISPAQLIEMPVFPAMGGEERKGYRATSRTVVRCMLEDVIVSSKSNYLLTSNFAVLDHEPDELQVMPILPEVDPIVLAADDEQVTAFVESGGLTAEPLACAFPLVGVNSFNYWHWQVEFLPRLLACRDLPEFREMTILVDEQMPRQSFEALRFCIGDEHPVRVLRPGEAVRVRQLWTCSMFLYIPLWPDPEHAYAPETFTMDSDAFAQQFRTLQSALEKVEPKGPRRIFLTRKGSQHRGVANRDEVEAWFAERGFELVDMGELGFIEQLRVMRAADVIIGPNGAALINSLYARPGTRIGVLDNPYDDNETYAEVCRALGQKLLFLVGEVVDRDAEFVYNSTYRIPVALLPAFLDRLLSDSGEPSAGRDTA